MRRLAVPCLLLSCVLGLGASASAQTLGTFRWQLQPYCNVITVTVVQQGTQYQVDGTDDQCGASQQAGVTGLAFLNPNGTVGFGLNIVTAPGGTPVHVDASFAIGTFSGTWRDSAGATGAFTFTPGAGTAGSARPAPVTGDVTGVTAGAGLTGGGTSGGVALAVDFAATQQRVTGACPVGQLMTAVNQNGTVACQAVQGTAGGDITSVVAGAGLAGGATTGDATLAVAFAGPGSLALAARSDHTHTDASANTAVGPSALVSNTTGSGNTAIGASALEANTAGGENIAIGVLSLQSNTTGVSNIAIGNFALDDNVGGGQNVAVGTGTLGQLTAGGRNIALGWGTGDALAAGSGNLYIGNSGTAPEDNTTRIGTSTTRTFVAGIRGVTTGVNDAVQVVVDSNGQLGTVSSSARTKDDIRDLSPAAAGLLQRLRPVQFRYTAPFANGERPVQYGLIAEEVEAVAPELVAYNAQGEVETVKYHVLPSLLLAEVQRLERERASLTEQLREQAAALAALRALVDELRARAR